MQRKGKENLVSSWSSGPTPTVDSRLDHWEAPLSQISLNVSMSQALTVWTPPSLSHTYTHTHITDYFTERCRTGQGLSSQAHSCPSPAQTTKGSKWPHRRQSKSLQGEEGENLERRGRGERGQTGIRFRGLTSMTTLLWQLFGPSA